MENTNKLISYKCEGKFDGRKVIQINGRITINVDGTVKTSYMKKILYSESYYM